MSTIFELDPVSYRGDIWEFNLDNEPDLDFLNWDDKVDWFLPEQECLIPPSNGEENTEEKKEEKKNGVTGNKLLDRYKQEKEKIKGRANEPIQEISEELNKLPPVEVNPDRNQINDFEKVAKNGIKNYGKNEYITDDKDQSRRRKDVLLKSILRRFRKYFQIEFADFTRLQFLGSSSDALGGNNKDIFPLELERENTQSLTKEKLESFVSSEKFNGHRLEEVHYAFFGALISPRTFK